MDIRERDKHSTVTEEPSSSPKEIRTWTTSQVIFTTVFVVLVFLTFWLLYSIRLTMALLAGNIPIWGNYFDLFFGAEPTGRILNDICATLRRASYSIISKCAYILLGYAGIVGKFR